MNEALLEKAKAVGGDVLAHATVRGRGPEHALPRAGLLAATHSSLIFVLGDALNVGEASVLPAGEIRTAEFHNNAQELRLDHSTGQWLFNPLSEAEARTLLQAANLLDRYTVLGQRQEAAAESKSAAPRSADYAQWFDATAPRSVPATAPGHHFQGTLDQSPAVPPQPAPRRRSLPLLLAAIFGLALFSALIFTFTRSAGTPSRPSSPDGPVASPVGQVDSKHAVVRADGQLQVAANPRAGQAIVVEFRGLPGNAQDWITLVPHDAPANTYKEWFYLKGQRNGSLSFKPVTPGDYEVRAYHDWPAGGYVVHERTRLRVSE